MEPVGGNYDHFRDFREDWVRRKVEDFHRAERAHYLEGVPFGTPFCRALIDQDVKVGSDPIGHACLRPAVARLELDGEWIPVCEACAACLSRPAVDWVHSHARSIGLPTRAGVVIVRPGSPTPRTASRPPAPAG